MLFQRRDIDQYTNSLGEYLPGGKLFAAKSIQNSNFRKLLRGMAGELFRANGALRDFDSLPDYTEKFLSEWESTLGIPDTCLKGTGSNEERRRDILVKLASLGVQTADDFVAIGLLFGITVTVNPLLDEISFPLTFPIPMWDSHAARFTIVVRFTVREASRFPLTFPILFGEGDIAVLECLFTHLKPANCNLIFQQV